MTLFCSGCKKIKSAHEFHKSHTTPRGFSNQCKECKSLYGKEWRTKNVEYLESKKEETREYARKWRAANKESVKVKKKQYYEANKVSISERTKKYRKANKDIIRVRKYNYKKTRLKTDSGFKLKENLRKRATYALKGSLKPGSFSKLLGCTSDELREYIESKFQPGMTWENYGLHGWHLDHVIPLSKFNLLDPGQYRIAVYHTNLQPLWAADNLRKSNK